MNHPLRKALQEQSKIALHRKNKTAAMEIVLLD